MSAHADGAVALLGQYEPESAFALEAGRVRTQADFLRDAQALAQRLPAGTHLLNFCQQRYRFAVGFAAALLAGRTSLLPSTRTPEVLRRIEPHYGRTACLHDGQGLGELCGAGGVPGIDLLDFPADIAAAAPSSAQPAPALPCVASARVAAEVFTSGSTGAPQPHAKTWGSLVASARAEAAALGLAGRRWSLVGTVPSQHMYGFESLILLALHGGAVLWAGHPFYPADIDAALARMPRPRMLVTTPAHLRALIAARQAGAGSSPDATPGHAPPVIDQLLSATAPLPLATAHEAEAALGAPLLEIYGATETGQLASRRSLDGPSWRLFPGVALHQHEGRTWAQGGHVARATALSDIIALGESGHFELLGRDADLVNIAGKRSSLAYLNHALLAVKGVVDGCVFVPLDEGPQAAPDSTRVCALVVAPALSAADLLAALRRTLDPAFLPRPVIHVEQLPRNATGKLPAAALQALYQAHRARNAGGA